MAEFETGKQKTHWLKLKIARHCELGDSAEVEFTATYRVGGGSAQRMREISYFVREQGLWYYVRGDIDP